MNEDNKWTLVPETNNERVVTTLEQINTPLNNYVKSNNLPIDNILAPAKESSILFTFFPNAISDLSDEQKQDSEYLTKFAVACAVGLFDGALNFLWDEVITSLRRKIVEYDLEYFYSVAEQVNKNYKDLKSEEDLVIITDHDLLDIIKRIGYIDEFGYRQLDNINYLRNHASAAHPNNRELTGIKLAELLQTGIKYGILIEPDKSMIDIKRLFSNIRTEDIPSEDFDSISNCLLDLESNRLNDFFKSIFGLYCDPKISSICKKNVIEISKRIWSEIDDETKYFIGAKFGYYRINGDVQRRENVNNFLESVDGLKYKDTDSIVTELIEMLQQLRTVHYNFNNFYNEYGYARDIEKIVPDTGVPDAAKNLFVKIICLCYAGNGLGFYEGVDISAALIYDELIDNFENVEIKYFIKAFSDADFTRDFSRSKPDKRIRDVANKLISKTNNGDLIEGLKMIVEYPPLKLENICLEADYKELIKKF